MTNHNAYAEEVVRLKLARPRASYFDRKSGRWRPLGVKGGAVSLRLSPAGGELLRLE